MLVTVTLAYFYFSAYRTKRFHVNCFKSHSWSARIYIGKTRRNGRLLHGQVGCVPDLLPSSRAEREKTRVFHGHCGRVGGYTGCESVVCCQWIGADAMLSRTVTNRNASCVLLSYSSGTVVCTSASTTPERPRTPTRTTRACSAWPPSSPSPSPPPSWRATRRTPLTPSAVGFRCSPRSPPQSGNTRERPTASRRLSGTRVSFVFGLFCACDNLNMTTTLWAT